MAAIIVAVIPMGRPPNNGIEANIAEIEPFVLNALTPTKRRVFISDKGRITCYSYTPTEIPSDEVKEYFRVPTCE